MSLRAASSLGEVSFGLDRLAGPAAQGLDRVRIPYETARMLPVTRDRLDVYVDAQKSSCFSVGGSSSRGEKISNSASSSVSLWTERNASPATRTAVCGPASKTSWSILNVTIPEITK